MDSIFTSLILAAVGALLGVVVKHFFDNPIREIAFNLPWFRVKKNSLAGYWVAEYGFHECGNEASYTSVFALYELIEWPGNNVLIREIHTDGAPATIVIGAKKRNSYLSGTYENAADHDMPHGVFQLLIHPKGKEMRGRFLGFSAETPKTCNVGEWLWSRLTTARTKDALDEAISKFTAYKESQTPVVFIHRLNRKKVSSRK